MKFFAVCLLFLLAVIALAKEERQENKKQSWKERLLEYRNGAHQKVNAHKHDRGDEAYRALLAHEQKRYSQLENLLENGKRRLQEHGRRLSDAEHAKLTTQLEMYQRKLEVMSRETAEDKREKLAEWQNNYHTMHRMDYIDFTKTGLKD